MKRKTSPRGGFVFASPLALALIAAGGAFGNLALVAVIVFAHPSAAVALLAITAACLLEACTLCRRARPMTGYYLATRRGLLWRPDALHECLLPPVDLDEQAEREFRRLQRRYNRRQSGGGAA